ncbi:MAG: putative addiction module antidote protein [Betaproteobacteria bacterium]|nr:putative addiction module antidote protein [Betaproteobacteria bacterium]
MAEKFTRWDAVDYLKNEKDMAYYLDACLEEDSGDGNLIRAALNDIARSRGMTQLARDTGLTREGLYRALSPEGNPEFSTMLKVIKALRITLHAAPAEKTKVKKPMRKRSSIQMATA